MVKQASGSFRKVENMHLSRIACLLIAENADSKKPQVQMAREYFKQEISTPELIDNSLSSNILLYKTKQGESRIEVIFNNEIFGCRKSEWPICLVLKRIQSTTI